MLFVKNDRRIKFNLLRLNRLDDCRNRQLIIKNGGEICETSDFQTITLAHSDISPDDTPLFHVTYVRECLRLGKLLDPVLFRFDRLEESDGSLTSRFDHGTKPCLPPDDIIQVKHESVDPTMGKKSQKNIQPTLQPHKDADPSPSGDKSARAAPNETLWQKKTWKKPIRKSLRIGQRNYSQTEKRQMVNYLIDKGRISEARGYRVWMDMNRDGHSDRTYQSLNNHFRKSILPNIHRFQMDPASLRQFQKIRG